jgi:capsular polysaccharide biosynthesis protein
MYTKALEGEYYSSIAELFRLLWRRKWVLLLTLAVVVGAAVGLSSIQEPTYEATAKVLVGQKQPEQADDLSFTGSNIQGLQMVTQTMTVAVDSEPVAESVVQQLDLGISSERLLKDLEVGQIEGTQFIELAYIDSDPERAQRVVNAVGDTAAKRVSGSIAGAGLVEVKVWDYATVPGAPIGPNPVRNGLLAVGLGLMLGLGLIFILQSFDNRWRSVEEIEKFSSVPNFGVIPVFDLANIKKIRGT